MTVASPRDRESCEASSKHDVSLHTRDAVAHAPRIWWERFGEETYDSKRGCLPSQASVNAIGEQLRKDDGAKRSLKKMPQERAQLTSLPSRAKCLVEIILSQLSSSELL